MHWSHGLQGSLKRRYKHPSPTSINGYHTAKKLLSQSPAKRPTFAFADESGYTLAFANRIAHSGLHAETGAVSDGGAITTLGAFHTFRKPCVARYQNGKLCRFWGLVGCAPEERGEPAEQRCAYARRCPEASRPRRAARSGEYAMDYVVSICTLDDNNNRLCRRSRNSCFCACGGGQIQHHN